MERTFLKSSSCQRSHIGLSVFGSERRHRVTVVLCDLLERSI